jgi:hypothetical protein
MSPPEVWGPAVWSLFHTLIEKLNPDAYPHVISSMFSVIVRICKFLPCPDCSNDASKFLAKITLNNYKTKSEFKNMLYLFHNWVNAKKRKPLYNHSHLDKYANLNLVHVINNFITKYNTKGNMKLLTESFQRNFVIKDFLSWFKAYSRAFVKPVIRNIIVEKPAAEKPVVEEHLVEEHLVEEHLVEEHLVEEHVVEEPVLEESSVEEHVTEDNFTVKESSNEEIVVTDEIMLEQSIITEDKKSKKKKNKPKK